MSFYPGETYAHEIKDGVDFYVQTRLIQKEEDGCAASEEDAAGQEWNVGIALWEQIKEGEAAGCSPYFPVPEGLEDFHLASSSRGYSGSFRPQRDEKCGKAAILPYAHRTHRP